MYKTVSKGILGRIGIWAMVAVMLIGLMPLAASAVEVSKNTTAITPIVNGETSVATHVEFARAASDSKVTKINLTKNLVFAELQQFTRKTEGPLVVDGGGMYGIRVAKSDWWQSPVDPTNHVSMEFKDGYNKITFQNITLSGEAFNGFVYPKEGAHLVFDGVKFDGPALAITKNRQKKYSSTVTIKNSIINLNKRVPDNKDSAKKSYIYPSEAVEMGYGDVILAGEVNITKNDPANTDLDHDEIFYFKEKEGSVIVEPGATVNINNYSKVNGSSYWSGLVFIGNALANINFTVGKDAEFNYYGEGGVIIENYGLKNFTVEENAKVNLKVFVPQNARVKSVNLTADTGSYFKAGNIAVKANAKLDVILANKSLFAREAVVGVEHLTVNENAAFRVISQDNTVGETALRMHGKTPSIYLDRPDEVLIYNGNKPFSAKSATNAIEAAGILDGLLDDAKADIAFTYIGAGIRARNAANDRANIGSWTADPAKSSIWTTSFRAKTFTLKGLISRKDGSFLKATLSDPDNYLGLDVTAANNPASAAAGIKGFKNKSIIQFNGSSAPIDDSTTPIVDPSAPIVDPSAPELLSKTFIREYFIDGMDFINLRAGNAIEVEGNGVDPIIFDFPIDQYESLTDDLSNNFVFNVSDDPLRLDYAGIVGTKENLPPNVKLNIVGKTARLTIAPDVNGVYPEVKLFYASKMGLYPYPDYWYTGERWVTVY